MFAKPLISALELSILIATLPPEFAATESFPPDILL
jgi:hypothetical protein